MKILVTGGLGTIGHVLVKDLHRRGHEVWLCDLAHSHRDRYIRCDVGNYRQLSNIFDNHNFDYVYHLAAEFGRWNGEEYYDVLWQTNAVGTKSVIKLQEKHNFRLIFTSSSEVYGDYKSVMAENVMDNHEIKQLNDYAMTKWINEQQIINSQKMHNTESVRVRLFNTYGPGEYYSNYRSVICKFIYHALHGMPYKVFLDHHRTSSYVTDTVATLCNILGNFIPGEVYNIAGDEYHDIKYLSDLILSYLGKKDSRVKYVKKEPFTTKDKKPDVIKAKKDLKHSSRIKLEEGIPRTIEWMKAVYRPIKDE
ncbi:MAG: NAD(P)-dependent oxidoreductase [Candidatus Omnitrophica bacterium]|nr:NAD(P)-dependent oxidoreductase [Candidatus Omnitrophota bacterium]